MTVLRTGPLEARLVSQRIASAVATTAALTAIPADRRADGQLCLAAAKLYRFDGSATNTGAGTLTPDAGDGRWIEVIAGGTDFKDSVRVASTANLVGTRTGAILLADANGAIAAMDGVTLVAGDRILMKDQTTGADKGIYVITALGDGSSKWSMTRAADFDTSAKVTAGAIIPVSEGTLGGNKTWQLTTNDAITLNTTALTFAAVGAAIGVATPTAVAAAASAGSTGNAADEGHAHNDPLRAVKGTDVVDDAVAMAIAQGRWRVLQAATLSANRSQALSVTGAVAGDQMLIERLDLTDYTYTVTDAGPGTPTLFVFPGGSVGGVLCQFDGTNWFAKHPGIKHAAASATIPGTMTAAHYAFLAGGVKGFCVKGVADTNVANLAAFVIAGFDSVTYAEGDLVLLANQTTGAECGVYQVGAVAGTAPLTRVNWMPTGAILSGGFTVHSNTGALYANTNWFISTAGDITIGTTAHLWFPESVIQSLAIPAGTGTLTITNVPILSATKTMFNFTNGSEVTADLTVRYGLSAAATPGTVGTASAVMLAEIAAGTVNVDDDSTMLVQIVNR